MQGRAVQVLIWLCALLVLAAVVYVMGQVTTLTCERVEVRVDCTAETALLGLVPLNERAARGVTGARLDDFCDDDGCRYRVELVTEAGNVPVTSYHSAGTSLKKKMIEEVNAFAGDPAVDSLQFKEHLDPTTLILPALLIVGVYAWTRWRRSRESKDE